MVGRGRKWGGCAPMLGYFFYWPWKRKGLPRERHGDRHRFLFFLSLSFSSSFLKFRKSEGERRILECFSFFSFKIKSFPNLVYIFFHSLAEKYFVYFEKNIFNFRKIVGPPPRLLSQRLIFRHNFFPCLFQDVIFLIAPFLFVEEEKPAAMHGGDRRNATSRASINVMLIFLTFLGIRASSRLCPRQTCATWPAYPLNFVTELIQARE